MPLPIGPRKVVLTTEGIYCYDCNRFYPGKSEFYCPFHGRLPHGGISHLEEGDQVWLCATDRAEHPDPYHAYRCCRVEDPAE